MELDVLTPADITEVMRIERLPGYEATVGRFEADERLDVALGNPRGRHVYEREGFEAYDRDDFHDLMRIPRERWRALRGR